MTRATLVLVSPKEVPLDVVVRAQAGDAAAFAIVCNGTNGLVHWWARKLSRGDETVYDDIVGEGHIAIYDALRCFKPGRSKWSHYVSIWLKAKMARAKKIAWKRNEVELAPARHLPTAIEPADEALAVDQQAAHLRAAVALLPEKQRLIMKHRLLGLSRQQVGEITGLSRERVRQIEARAVEKIRSRLGIVAGPFVLNKKRRRAA